MSARQKRSNTWALPVIGLLFVGALVVVGVLFLPNILSTLGLSPTSTPLAISGPAASTAVPQVVSSPAAPTSQADTGEEDEIEYVVPNVIGMDRESVQEYLTAGGYSFEIVEVEIAGESESGLVVQQSPLPLTKLSPGDVITVKIPVYISITSVEPILGTTITREGDGMKMVYVPSGEFSMGSNDDDLNQVLGLCNLYYGECQKDWWDDEQPKHTVSLDGFWIDRTEVTNAQFQRCVDTGACAPPYETHSAMRDSYYGNGEYGNYPVIYVAWQQAKNYCEWAGARLPTEAEWEYAARGSGGRLYPWGEQFDGTRLNYCDANCPVGEPDEAVDDGYPETAPVGSYPSGASWCGALDMAGNVWEMVEDWYGRYPSSSVHNPQGTDSGESWVMRGGAWDVTPDIARTTNRYSFPPDGWNYAVGFRCASSP